MDQLTAQDYERIRKKHPARAKQLIVRRSLRLERDQAPIALDDLPDYTEPIALVSQGHGSEYFRPTVEELRLLREELDPTGLYSR